jgi:hypothetical protein
MNCVVEVNRLSFSHRLRTEKASTEEIEQQAMRSFVAADDTAGFEHLRSARLV